MGSESSCQTVTFLEHDERMCAPRARLGVRAIRWAIRQLRFEGATIAGLARQLATTWNTVWSHIKPCLLDLTRGEDHPTARLLDLVPGRSGTVYKNWLEGRGEQFRSGIQIATLDPFQGQQERH